MYIAVICSEGSVSQNSIIGLRLNVLWYVEEGTLKKITKVILFLS